MSIRSIQNSKTYKAYNFTAIHHKHAFSANKTEHHKKHTILENMNFPEAILLFCDKFCLIKSGTYEYRYCSQI